MCGRFALMSPLEAIRKLFGLSSSGAGQMPNIPARYNIAPTQAVLGLRPGMGEDLDHINPGPLNLTSFRWGLIPNWSKDPAMGARMINARAETVADKPSFRAPFKRRRCLIPVDGFYEWRTEGKGKQPYFICMEDRDPFAFAGLWEYWMGADGSEVETCTIVTTTANGKLTPIHNRMPVILDSEDFDPWLRGGVDQATRLMKPYAGYREISYFPVGKAVSNARNEGPGLIEPIELEADPRKGGEAGQFNLF